MELEWPRQTPAQRLSREEIESLIVDSGIEPATATLIQEGLANTNYRVLGADGRDYHLRILQRDPRGLATEVAVMQRMAPKLPVPIVRFWSESPALLVSDWADGQTLQRIEASGDRSTVLALGRQLGQMLAALQSERFDRAGLLGANLEIAEPWPSVYDGLRGFMEHAAGSERCRERTPQELLDRVRKAWDRLEPQLRRAAEEPCLSHADFKPSNILADGGCVTALLDWEFAHAGTWLLDAGQILRYMGDRKRPLAEQIAHGLVAAGVQPPPGWFGMASTIDTASLCDFLGRPTLAEPQRLTILGLLSDELDISENN